MARTQLTGHQLNDSSIQRDDLDSTTVGQAVIKKLIAGNGINITFTGADFGTGDVTINAVQADDLTAKADTVYVDSKDAGLVEIISTKASITNFSISTINAATRLIQTQRIMAQLVSTGQL